MSIQLIEALEKALHGDPGPVQEVYKDASVLVQFSAGDWYALKMALKSDRAAYDAAHKGATPTPEPDASAAEDRPAPTLSSIDPTSVMAGSSGFTLTATGTGFVKNSAVQIGGSALATTYVSPTQLSATVPDTEITSGGTQEISVLTPTPGGGTSLTVALTVAAVPMPVLVSITPTSAIVGSTAPTLTVNGSGFATNSVVEVNGAARVTTFVSATELTAVLLAGDIATPSAPAITVVTPDVGPSAPLTFNVFAAAA